MSLKKIGDKVIEFSQSFIVRDHEKLELEVPVDGWLIKLKFSFQKTENKKDRSIKIAAGENEVEFILYNWDSSLGTATTEPVEFGEHQNGKLIFLMASNFAIGGTNQLTVQILLGGKNG